MTMTQNRRLMFGLVLAAAVAGVWLWKSPESPLAPKKPDRPALKALLNIGRFAAKLGLWVALCGEDNKAQPQMVHARIGEDGASTLDNGNCW